MSGDSEPHTSLSHHLATHHEAVSVQLCHTKEESYAQSRGGFFQVHRQRVAQAQVHHDQAVVRRRRERERLELVRVGEGDAVKDYIMDKLGVPVEE